MGGAAPDGADGGACSRAFPSSETRGSASCAATSRGRRGDRLCFENEADAHKGRTVVLSMENEAERDAWRAVLDKGVVSRLPSQLAPRVAETGELPLRASWW